jgi:N-formylglutamate amidohydrolase
MAFQTSGPNPPQSPVVISVPHGGRDYPAEMAALARLDRIALRPLEDRFADYLVHYAVEAGCSAIIAQTARAWIDLNRSEREYDPALIHGATLPALSSAKVRGGLGIIPKRMARRGDIWRSTISGDAFEARLAVHHRPYHAALSTMIESALATFGTVFLIDVHSMPPLPRTDGEPSPQIIIGDLFGRSAAPRYSHAVASVVARTGLSVAMNTPYAGGHILERHTDPARGIHGFQIEIDRTLYLDERGDQPGEGLPTMQRLIAAIAMMLEQEVRALAFPMAAE